MLHANPTAWTTVANVLFVMETVSVPQLREAEIGVLAQKSACWRIYFDLLTVLHTT